MPRVAPLTTVGFIRVARADHLWQLRGSPLPSPAMDTPSAGGAL
jgi:hypothetical protein